MSPLTTVSPNRSIRETASIGEMERRQALPEPLSAAEALAAAAKECRLTPLGLLVRALAQAPRFLPNMFRGAAPQSVKLKFILVPAIRAALAERLTAPEADRTFRRFLYAVAAAAPQAAFGRKFPLKFAIRDLARKYRAVFRGAGKHQQVAFAANREDEFRFFVLKCSFHAALTDFGLAEYTSEICRADRWYWTHALRNTEIFWSKNHDTLGCRGPYCHTVFRQSDEAVEETPEARFQIQQSPQFRRTQSLSEVIAPNPPRHINAASDASATTEKSPAHPPSMPEALSKAAEECGLTKFGFLLRAFVCGIFLLPRVFRGQTAAAVMLKCVLVPASLKVFQAHLPPDRADGAFRRFLFSAAFAASACGNQTWCNLSADPFGRKIPLKTTLRELAEKFKRRFRSSGQHQKVVIE
jgi:hypothetical protein